MNRRSLHRSLIRATLIGSLLGGIPVSDALAPSPAIAQAAPHSAAAAPESARAAQIKAHLQDILSSSDYRVEKAEPSALERFWKWVSDLWERFMRWLGRLFSFGSAGGVGGAGYFMVYLLYGGLIIGLAYVIVYAIRRLASRTEAEKGRKKPGVGVIEEPEESASVEPDAWLAAAQRHAAAGDFRRAYRAVFIAILLRMDRMGALQFERSRTNGEYLRALRGRTSLFSFLRPLANDFDRHWYGESPVTEIEYRHALSAYEQVRSELAPSQKSS